jgi:hypothetical protein
MNLAPEWSLGRTGVKPMKLRRASTRNKDRSAADVVTFLPNGREDEDHA